MRRAKRFFTQSVETVTAHVNLVSGTLVEAGYENEMLEKRVNVTCDLYAYLIYSTFVSISLVPSSSPAIGKFKRLFFFVIFISLRDLIFIIKILGEKDGKYLDQQL